MQLPKWKITTIAMSLVAVAALVVIVKTLLPAFPAYTAQQHPKIEDIHIVATMFAAADSKLLKESLRVGSAYAQKIYISDDNFVAYWPKDHTTGDGFSDIDVVLGQKIVFFLALKEKNTHVRKEDGITYYLVNPKRRNLPDRDLSRFVWAPDWVMRPISFEELDRYNNFSIPERPRR